MKNVDSFGNFGIAGKVGKVSDVGAVKFKRTALYIVVNIITMPTIIFD